MLKIRKGDEVQIVRGGDRPQTAEDMGKPSGRVIAVDLVRGRCKVEGRGLVWKNKRGTGPESPGGRSQQEGWISLSNVMLFNKATNKAEKVSFKVQGGKKVRVFKKSGALVDAK